jgi:hypothetical protein
MRKPWDFGHWCESCEVVRAYLSTTCGFRVLTDVWGRDHVLQKLLDHSVAELAAGGRLAGQRS